MNDHRSAGRAGALALTLLIIVAAGVRLALGVWPPQREAWVLVGVTVDTSALYARLSSGSTGFYDRQVTSRLAALPAHGFPVEHRAMMGPANPSSTGISGSTDSLTLAGSTWHLKVSGDDVQVRASVKGAGGTGGGGDGGPGGGDGGEGPCPPALGSLRGVLGVGDGAENSGAFVLDGTAMVFRTTARGVVHDRALYVLGRRFSAGVDPLADCPAWVTSGESTWTGEAPGLPSDEEIDVALGEWRLHVRRISGPLKLDSYGHLLPFEQWAARLVGWPEPHQSLQRVTVSVEGPDAGSTTESPGLILDRGVR